MCLGHLLKYYGFCFLSRGTYGEWPRSDVLERKHKISPNIAIRADLSTQSRHVRFQRSHVLCGLVDTIRQRSYHNISYAACKEDKMHLKIVSLFS